MKKILFLCLFIFVAPVEAKSVDCEQRIDEKVLKFYQSIVEARGEEKIGIIPNLERPLQTVSLGSPYGPRRHPISGKWRKHTGVDLPTYTGAPVIAAGGGKVTLRLTRGGYGRMVIINHGKGWETRYAHLNKWAPGIRTGVTVAKGRIIGYVGSSGSATGSHLHYEVRLNGHPINPELKGCRYG